MISEVTRGGFGDEGKAPRRRLSEAAEFGVRVLDQAHAVPLARLNTARRAIRGQVGRQMASTARFDETLRGDLDLKSHFQSIGSTRAMQRRGA